MTASTHDTRATLAEDVLSLARDNNINLVTAESCTGGLIIAALTDIAGSSDVVDRGFITYSNAAKTAMLNVPADMIADHGAVSKDVAMAMVEGACQNADHTDNSGIAAVAVTGIAGPAGGTPQKPVGTVWFGLHIQYQGSSKTLSWVEHFKGDRDDIRQATVHSALTQLKTQITALTP